MRCRHTCLALLVSLLGCSSTATKPPAADGSTGPQADSAVEAGTDASGLTTDDGASTDTPAQRRLAWVLAALNGAPLTDADITSSFGASVLMAIAPADLRAAIGTLAQHKPWTQVGFDGDPTPTSLTAVLVRDDGEYFRLQIVVEASPPQVIDRALLTPAGDLDPALSTYAAVDSAVAALAPNAALLAANLDGAGPGCTPIHSLNPTSSLALGSAFKLWVLATLAQSIESGAHAWTDAIAIEDRYKSLPSGTLQNTPAGTKLPLLTIADQMISISDNTAADHLLFTLGRSAVEAMLATTAHHDPTLNQPFLSTRELFDVKLLLSAADQQAFVASSAVQRRALLATYDLTLDPRSYAGPPWASPILVDRVEWFATPGDLCGVMATLKGYGDKAATKNVLDILAINPGIPSDKRFAYVGYKGGSEPGVLDLTWLLQRASDKTWAFFSVGWNDTAHAIDEARATYVASAGRALLAQ